MAAALTMEEAILCSNMMREMGIGTRFDSVPVYIVTLYEVLNLSECIV